MSDSIIGLDSGGFGRYLPDFCTMDPRGMIVIPLLLVVLCNIPTFQINKEDQFPFPKFWSQQKLKLNLLCVHRVHACML
jgi:hypothetical protein